MTALTQLGAVVLAAGRSSRMRAEYKLLKIWRGKPLLDHCLSTVAGLNLACVCVVTGARGEEVRKLVDNWPVKSVENAAFASGVASSIATGVAAMPDNARGVFIVLGDMPMVQREDFEALSVAFSPETSADICVCFHDGRRGHPVLFGRRHFADLLALQGDRGAAEIIARHPGRVARVEHASAGVLLDFDTASDFARA